MEYLDRLKHRQVIGFTLLLVLLVITFVLCVILGSVDIKAREVFQIILTKDKKAFDNGVIVWTIRLPRVLATIVGGGALAISGLLLQVFFRNPIVEPYVLGISSGATLGVGLVMLGGLTLGTKIFSAYTIFLAALLGSLIVTLIVVLFAAKVKDITTLLVIGIMIGYIASAITRTLIAFADKEKLHGFTLWTMGSFSGFTWKNVKVLFLMGLPALVGSFFIVKPLNAFLMGEEYAKSMGVNIKVLRIVIVLISSILTAAVTAFAGPVAFIGLAVPHLSRLLFGLSDNKILVPGTILMGAIITSLCDLISRLIFAPVELPISAVTSLFGAPIVIVLILKNRKVKT